MLRAPFRRLGIRSPTGPADGDNDVCGAHWASKKPFRLKGCRRGAAKRGAGHGSRRDYFSSRIPLQTGPIQWRSVAQSVSESVQFAL